MAIVKNDSGKWITTLDSAREFHLKMDAAGHEKTLGLQQEGRRLTDSRKLSDLVDIWHKLHGRMLKDGLRRYKLLHAMAERLGNPVAVDLTNEHFAHYRQKRALTVTTTTANREHSYLRAVFNELTRLGVITYPNPLSNVRQFKERDSELRFLTGSEITELLEACSHSSNPSLTLVVRICLSTGARWGEAEGLLMKHCVNNQLTFTDTKGGKNRAVPVSDELFNSIIDLDKKGNERLFIGCLGAFRRALAETNIKLPRGQFTHVLRHTFASHFVMNGGNIVVLKEILGHSTITTTMRYSHLAPDFLSDAVALNPLTKPCI